MGFTPPNDVRLGPLLALPQLLREHDVDPEEFARRTGVPLILFESPENRLPLKDICRLLLAAEQVTGRPGLAMLVAQRADIGSFGLLGELMTASATVGQALEALVLHLHNDDRASVPILSRPDSNTVFLGYLLHHPAELGFEQALGAALSVAAKVLRELCGPGWRCRSVQFSHREPSCVRIYREIFGRNATFNAEFSGLYFDAAWLNRPLPASDAVRWSRIHRSLLNSTLEPPVGFAEQVMCALFGLLATGGISAENLARMFACSERTLRSRLKREGVSQQQLLAEVRFQRARHLLRGTDLPVSRIAAALSYADTAVFSRAFNNWAGISPRQWRNANRMQ